MRTLFLTSKALYPPRGGAAWRNWNNIRVTAPAASTAAISVTRDPEPDGEADTGLALTANFHSRVLMRPLGFLHRKFIRLSRLGHPLSANASTPVMRQQLERAIRDFRPELVVLEEAWLLPCVRAARATGAQIVFDNHNVEVDVSAHRVQTARGLKARAAEQFRHWQTAAVESELIAGSDQVWVCSDEDRKRLIARYGRTDGIVVVPNVVDIDFFRPAPGREKQPRDDAPVIGLVATFGYAPNEIAALRLLRTIFPAIRKRWPTARLMLIGKNPTNEMMRHAQDPGVTVTGPVDDVRTYLESVTVMAVPLTAGSGTRLKILEAFAARIPVVTSMIGAEGIAATNGVELLLAEDDRAFIDALGRIVAAPALARSLSSAAFALAERHYSLKRLGEIVSDALRQLPARSGRNDEGKARQ